MHLDAAAAQALAIILFSGTQGADHVQSQRPFEVIDRGGSWLVKGTPYTDTRRGFRFCFSHAMLRKDTAEVVSFGSEVRQILTEDEEQQWKAKMSDDEFARIFGPRTYFEEGSEGLQTQLFVNDVFNGGLINKPADAVAYAKIIMRQNPNVAAIPISALRAEERGEVWHITVADPKSSGHSELMSVSRINGKVLSGAP